VTVWTRPAGRGNNTA